MYLDLKSGLGFWIGYDRQKGKKKTLVKWKTYRLYSKIAAKIPG